MVLDAVIKSSQEHQRERFWISKHIAQLKAHCSVQIKHVIDARVAGYIGRYINVRIVIKYVHVYYS